MARNLTALIEPMADKLAWYPMNELSALTDGAEVEDLADESGSGNSLTIIGAGPTLELSALNGRPGLIFSGGDPLRHDFDTPIGAKHIFIIAMADGASFDAYRGLISATTSNSLLLGDSGQTKFFNLGLSGFNYYKSQVSYAQGSQQAPFNAFELIEMSVSGGVSLDGVMLGQDKSDVDRRWSGYIIEPLIFTSEQDSFERKRVNLYYDLKYSLWKRNGVVQYEIYYPSPAIVPELPYFHYREVPLDWDAVTITHKYDDEGVSMMDTTDTPEQVWEIEYTGLTQDEVEIFDEFANQVRRKHTFNFIAKDGTEHTGVRLRNYERNHEENKSWSNNVKITLVKSP